MAATTVKMAISTPLGERQLNDEAAARHGMNRSEFYTNAAARYRAELTDRAEQQARELDRVLDLIGNSASSWTHASDSVLGAEIW